MVDHLVENILKCPLATQWKKIGIYHHHGINLLLSSLHSKKSCGIGEFFDLIPIIDWCHKLKLDLIQLLPLTDSGDDPSPYFSLSSCALNPLFLSLDRLPYLDHYPELEKKLADLRKLNEFPRVAFPDVVSHKYSWFSEYFDKAGERFLKQKGFQEFWKENPWVEGYALFKAIKKTVSKNHWMTWPNELKNPSKEEYQELLKRHANDLHFFILLQYLCYLQLSHVKEYANSKEIYLEGDIPILISPDSADVWQFQDQFDLSLVAGAPPDIYTEEGQVWGVPLFNWDVVKKTNYSWWKQRISYAANFFNLYRIDHIVGFFRIWAIPPGYPSKDGFFTPKEKSKWLAQGREILEMLIENSLMLPIGEDLGVVPEEVRDTLAKLGICGTKILRWERKWKEDKSFIPFQEYHPVSMTSVSTHDSEPLQLWWRDIPDEAKSYAEFKHWDYKPYLTISQRKQILWDSHHTSSLFHVNLLQEYLAIFPQLVWENPEDERINIPGKVLPTNWTYRFRCNVEEICSHESLKKEISNIVFSPKSTFSLKAKI
ncbi:MAG: 4-alpha-glucanotransferase [Chlamydiae bacterium]|nr:4-alpha-glucanotransferase [Chlamydiota bacterium]